MLAHKSLNFGLEPLYQSEQLKFEDFLGRGSTVFKIALFDCVHGLNYKVTTSRKLDFSSVFG
jgi:hypothetical protein